MTNFINKWIFINYCGQKIGQFKNVNLYSPLLNVITGQVANLLLIPVFYCYFFIGFRNIFIAILIIIAIVYLTRKCLKKYCMINVTMQELETNYTSISRSCRIFYFVIAMLLTILCIVMFGCSFWLLKFL